ncbi:MAG: SLATT domain-containing protein [Luteitalea sp.]|nr:SLATT domain-containing protein [Luteitalea sp.]
MTRFHLGIGVPNAVFAATAGAIAFSFFANVWLRLAAGLLSGAAAALAALQTFLNPNERAAAHLNAGNKYEALNGRARIFWTVECWTDEPARVLTERLKDLALEKGRLNETCPQIPRWAYGQAKKVISDGEGTYSVDKPGRLSDRKAGVGAEESPED